MKRLLDWLPFFRGIDLARSYERGYDHGREVGFLLGFGERMRQENEARDRATGSLLRVIQGGKK